MNPNRYSIIDKSILLSNFEINNLFIPSVFVRVIIQLILLTAFLVSSVSTIAAPIITNTVTANFTINGNNLNLTDSVQFTKDTVVTPTDTLELTKVSNIPTVLIGNDVIYTLTIKNPTPRVLTNVSIQDTLPTGFIYQTDSAKLNSVGIDSNGITITGNTLTINLGTIPADTSWNITYQVNVSNITPVGNAINTAFATSDTATSSQTQANVVVSEPIVISPLKLTKTANKQNVKVGETIRYTLLITNDNNVSITGAVAEDLLPQGLEYLVGSAKLDGDPITANVGTDLSFNLGDITANSVSTLIYDVKVNTASNNIRELINTANITANDSQANSNTASANITVIDDTLALTKTTTSNNVYAGDVVEYKVTLTNPLPRDLSNLKIIDTLPIGFNYLPNSATVNNVLLSSNDVFTSGNIIDFTIGTLASSSSIVLSYSTTINQNAVPGDNINTVQAISDFAGSLTATAMVKVRTPSTINFLKISNSGINSVIQPTSYNTNQQGGKNFEEITNIILTDGTNITLPMSQPIIDANQYTTDEPVVIEVIDLDQNLDPTVLDTVEVIINIPGTNDTEILLLTETSPNSGTFRGIILTTVDNMNIQDGVLTVADGVEINVVYSDQEDNTDNSATAALIVPNTTLQIEKTANKDYSSVGELVRYNIEFRNTTGFNLTNVKLNDVLPIGFRYIPNTAELNGNRLNNNIEFNGRNLTVNLSDMPTASVWTIEYLTQITAGVQIGDAINTAYISSGSLRSNDATAVVKIKDDLMRSKNILTGRIYIGCNTKFEKNKPQPKLLPQARIYTETGRSVLADTDGFWHMEGISPGAHVLQLDTESIPGFEPLLCDDNTRRAEDAKSQFIDLEAGNLWHVNFHVSPIKGYEEQDQNPQIENQTENNPSILFDNKYLESVEEGFEILWPKNNFVPDVASTKIFVKHSPQHTVDMLLNGAKVSPLNYDGSDTNKARTVTIRRWLGVDIDIKNKNNTLLAILKDKSGKEIARKTHNIHFSSNPASAKLLEERSILIADGKTTPVITLQVKDEDGFPMRANTHGYFTIENNSYSIKSNNNEDIIELNKLQSGQYKYDIKENGIAQIELNPTTQSGQVKLKLQFTDSKNSKKSEISAWLKPALREWILVGLAEGTLAHRNLSGNMEALKDLDKADKFSKRGRLAFFAKGQVKGKYLLTLAYDTHKQNRQIGNQLNGNIDPDAYYTIYADNSTSQHEAPSSEKLYVKIEKDNFYALFGDYQTNMTVTELATYQRTLNGIKTEHRGDRLSFKGFISQTSNNHHHEEIPGDGTSGLYQLKNNIIPNSETITIETRDRFHSDRVLLRRELSRYQDYSIDYYSGALFFKFPIPSRDRELNPQIIIVDYDSEENTNKSITAGGRAAIKSKNGKLETGLSVIHEGNNNIRDNRLVASDLTYKITPTTTIKAEIAQSKTEASSFENRKAYIIELEKEIAEMEARIYLKKQDSNFGIDSQVSENGIKKAGVELDYRVNDKTRINSEVSVQENLENENKRTLAQVEVLRQIKQYEISAGLRHTREDLLDENNVTQKIDSNVVLLGGQYTTKNDKLTLRSNIEKNVSTKANSEISPDRLIVGADYKINKNFSVFAEHETTDGGSIKTQNSRVGLSQNLWKGAKARTTYTQETNAQGQRNFATLGLSQTVKINDKITADFTVDQAKTIGEKSNQPSFNNDEPAIQGSLRDDYVAFSVGLGSNNEKWSWSTRAEYRNGEINDKINFLASLIRHYENGKSLSTKLSYYNSDNINGDYDKSAKLSFGSAWHPKEKDFVFFSRLDLVNESTSINSANSINAFAKSSNIDTQKIIHNMHYNRKINKKTRLGLHHGIKHVKDQNNGTKSSATIDTGTVKLRRDINKRWDIGAHAGYLRDWTNKAIDYVAGVSVGVSPRENIWMELGYNVEGFKDEDFDNNNYTSKGPYLDFRYKFNQDTINDDLHSFRKKKKKQTIVKPTLKNNHNKLGL